MDTIDTTSFVRLETDASVFNSRVVRGEHEERLCGFICKPSPVPPAMAEILGIIHGLNLCWARGYNQVKVVSDCTEAVDLILRGWALV